MLQNIFLLYFQTMASVTVCCYIYIYDDIYMCELSIVIGGLCR